MAKAGAKRYTLASQLSPGRRTVYKGFKAAFFALGVLGAGLVGATGALVEASAELSAASQRPQGWQKVENPAPVIGLDGRRHEARCSGFPGSDPRFSFWTRRGSVRKLLVYFEGGGACWDGQSCSFPRVGLPPEVPQFFDTQVPPGTDPARMDGLLRTNHPSNPVRDWDMVYIPYCTGDVHIGSASRSYTSVANPFVGLPAGQTLNIQHRGYDNFMVVLDWIRRQVRAPHQVLVAGSSAGGYGAAVNAHWIGMLYPGAQMHVLADSAQGVLPAAFDTSLPGRRSWNPQIAPWVFGPNAAAAPSGDLIRRAARSDPFGRYAQITPHVDPVQIGFYAAMAAGYGAGSCPARPEVEWHNRMSSELQSRAGSQRNFRYYVAAGPFHMLLTDPRFYAEQSGGQTVASWVSDLLAGRLRGPAYEAQSNGLGHGQGGHWSNQACPGCLASWACPAP